MIAGFVALFVILAFIGIGVCVVMRSRNTIPAQPEYFGDAPSVM